MTRSPESRRPRRKTGSQGSNRTVSGTSFELLVLRRTIGWGFWGSSGPDDRWMGRAIRFRHNALDPDDLHDVLFEGCADQAEPEAVTGGRR